MSGCSCGGGGRRTGVGLAAVLAAAAGLGAALPVAGQDDQRRLERVLRTTDVDAFRLKADTSLELLERTAIEVGGFTSITGVWLNDSDGNGRRLWQPETTVFGRASLDGAHTVFARARFAYRAFSEGDSFDGRGDRWDQPFLDRYWYEFDYRRATNNLGGPDSVNLNVRAGRQFVDWGASLVLSEVLFAVRPTLEFGSGFRLEGLAGITPDRTVDFDASRTDFDDRTRRGYYGGRAVATLADSTEVYASYIYMADYYNRTVSRSPIVLTDVNFNYETSYVSVGGGGAVEPGFLWQVEGTGQFGQSTSDPLRGLQTTDNVRAFAARALMQYVMSDANATRLSAEALLATGDPDRLATTDTVGGNAPGTTDRAFNSLGYANTGLAFGAALSNLISLRLGASTHPFGGPQPTSEFQVGVDGFVFLKEDSDGPIDEFTISGKRFLGGEVDLYANWRLTSDLAINLRYGVFLPGEAIGGTKAARHFVLIGAVLSF